MSIPLDILPPLPVLFRDTAVKGRFDTEQRAFYVKILSDGHILRNISGVPSLEKRRISMGDASPELVKVSANFFPLTLININTVLQTAENYDLNVGFLDQ